MRTYQFTLEDVNPHLSVIVTKVTDEYMRFLKNLYLIEHPYAKPIYGATLLVASIRRRKFDDTYHLSLPLVTDVCVPTDANIIHNTKPLTGHENKAAAMTFRSFNPDTGLFKDKIILPLIKHKEIVYGNKNSANTDARLVQELIRSNGFYEA